MPLITLHPLPPARILGPGSKVRLQWDKTQMKRMTIKTILALLLLVSGQSGATQEQPKLHRDIPGLTLLGSTFRCLRHNQPLAADKQLATDVYSGHDKFCQAVCSRSADNVFATKASNEVGISDFSTVAPVLSAPRSDAQLATVKPQ